MRRLLTALLSVMLSAPVLLAQPPQQNEYAFPWLVFTTYLPALILLLLLPARERIEDVRALNSEEKESPTS